MLLPRTAHGGSPTRLHSSARPTSPSSCTREGGFFKAELKFPDDFPNNPPEMRFITPMWHPNSQCGARARAWR